MVDPETVLTGVESLEVSNWELDHQGDARHMGPMAENFYERLGLGGGGEPSPRLMRME